MIRGTFTSVSTATKSLGNSCRQMLSPTSSVRRPAPRANPGTLGNLSPRYLFGPSFFNLDLALSKIFTVTERVSFEIRTDWQNATNTPSFANLMDYMTRNINSVNFGRSL